MDIVREWTHPITCVELLRSNPSANRFPHQLSQRRAENKHLGSRSSPKQWSSGRRSLCNSFLLPEKGFLCACGPPTIHFCQPAASRVAALCISQRLNRRAVRVRLTLLSAGCLSSYLFFSLGFGDRNLLLRTPGAVGKFLCRSSFLST